MAGEDPRIALRQRRPRSQAETQALRERLEHLDRRAADGPWTTILLRTIHAAPEVHARTHAATLGWEVDRLKRRVRILKNLGLTESLPVGYRLSPRGQALLAAIGS